MKFQVISWASLKETFRLRIRYDIGDIDFKGSWSLM